MGGFPGLPKTSTSAPSCKAPLGQEQKRRTGGGKEKGQTVTLVHRPHDAERVAEPPAERSLSLHLEGTGRTARRAELGARGSRGAPAL